MMLRKRLEIAERNVERLKLVVARVAPVVDAASAFVAVQAPLAQGDFAADKFQELEDALARLNALLPPASPSDPTPGKDRATPG